MNKLVLSIIFLFVAGSAYAQDQFELGKHMDSTKVAEMRLRLEQTNLNNVGHKFPDFDALTTEGKFLNADSLMGEVTLFVFWNPTCNCFDLKRLNDLYDKFKNNRAFRLVVVTGEMAGLSEYIKKEQMHFPFAIVSSAYQLREMRFNNGLPAFVVVNKFGIVSTVKSTFQRFNEKEFTELLTGLLQ